MYGKIFDSIYEGTLYGQWEALVTFQQMIVLCDADGMIDMTPQAIAARTSIPLEIIRKGISILEAPDPYSRTPDQEGRRIELIDAHRPWGWHIVNHAKYMGLQDADMVRAQTRERVRKHRAAKSGVTVTDGNASKRHTDIDIDTDKDRKRAETQRSQGSRLPADWQPSEELKAWASKERPDINLPSTVEKFRDYWHSKAGAGARKVDWDKTFRNWVRTEKAVAGSSKPIDMDAFVKRLEEQEKSRASG